MMILKNYYCSCFTFNYSFPVTNLRSPVKSIHPPESSTYSLLSSRLLETFLFKLIFLPMMHLQSKIWVRQNVEQVTKFFYAPDSLAKWDRSVAQMIPGTVDTNKAGATFETISPSG